MASDLRKICLRGSAVFVILAAWCGVGDASEGVLKGKEIYHERCAACHGVDGIAILPDAPNFASGERMDKSDEELLKTIKHGKGVMPAWEDKLSSEDIKDALSYVKVILGDKVFEEKCLKCHNKGIPKLRSDVPMNEDLKNYKEKPRVCSFCNITNDMTKEEIMGVIKYIRTFPGK